MSVFWTRAIQSGDCWLWTGQIDPDGYGVYNPTKTRKVRAHRWAYELLVAPIPDGLQLDHLCRNRACVNPYHLDPVTNAVNSARAAAARTHCKYGHEFTPDNTRMERRNRGSSAVRVCKACQSARMKARWANRHKGEAA